MRNDSREIVLTSDNILQARECFQLEQVSKAKSRLNRIAELNKLEKEARCKQTFDRESHVYLVRGKKQYYRVYREIDTFIGYGEVSYLGIAQEPIYETKKAEQPKKEKVKTSYTPPIGTVGRTGKFKQGMKCCYCEIPLTEKTFTKEHVVPKRVGGNILMECCYDCNNEKGGLMIHSYIQLLCYKECSGVDFEINQTKIKNANEIAKKYVL